MTLGTLPPGQQTTCRIIFRTQESVTKASMCDNYLGSNLLQVSRFAPEISKLDSASHKENNINILGNLQMSNSKKSVMVQGQSSKTIMAEV
jgi:hypothetical protein